MIDVSTGLNLKEELDLLKSMTDKLYLFNKELDEMFNMFNKINDEEIDININTDKAISSLKIFKGSVTEYVKDINKEFEKLNIPALETGAFTVPLTGTELITSKTNGENEPTIYDALTGGDMLSILGTGILSGVGAGATVGSPLLDIMPQAVAIGAIIGGIAGAVNSAIEIFENDDDAFRSYTKDQYEEIYSNRMTEVATGSAMADNAAQFALTNPDILKNQLAAESGSIYNDIVGEANGRQNQVLLSDGVENLYEAQAMFEGRVEAEKTDYNTDVMGYITGGRDELLKDYSDDMLKVIENTKIKYEEAMEVISAGEDVSGEEAYNQALANITEVKGTIESLGNNAYLESDLGQLGDDMSNSLVDGIQAASVNTFDEAGYNLGKNLAEGFERAVSEYTSSSFVLTEKDANMRLASLHYQGFRGKEKDYLMERYIIVGGKNEKEEKQNAYGIQYVPYNGYRAVLHEGERVLTASENREYKKNTGGIVINMNGLTVREEADVERVASRLAQKLEEADLGYYGDYARY